MVGNPNVEASRDLLRWWSRERDPIGVSLSAGFVFDDRGVRESREDFLLGVRSFAGLKETKILFLGACEMSAVAAVFEATDAATGRRLRFAWLIRFTGHEIDSVTATSAEVCVFDEAREQYGS